MAETGGKEAVPKKGIQILTLIPDASYEVERAEGKPVRRIWLLGNGFMPSLQCQLSECLISSKFVSITTGLLDLRSCDGRRILSSKVKESVDFPLA